MQKITAKSITNYEQLVQGFSQNKSWDAQYRLIIQLGKQLDSLPDALKVPENEVQGCESLAWLVMIPKGPYIDLQMDSDTRVVKGLMKIISIIFQDKTPQQIRDINCEALFSELGLLNHLSPSRTNGLFSIIKKIQAV